jgi:hypothetical protein
MSNFGTKKLVGALALAVAAIGIGTAVQTGAPARATIVDQGYYWDSEGLHTRTIN